jgi:mRNA guanylyltransferase
MVSCVEDFDTFRQDKKASSRIIECVYDPEWLTFVPSHDKSTWEIGNPELNATERGQGWRKGLFESRGCVRMYVTRRYTDTNTICPFCLITGGWKYVRSRPDKLMPLERGYLGMVEKAIGEDIKLEEFENLFPDDPSKKTSLMQKLRQDAPPVQDVRLFNAILI